MPHPFADYDYDDEAAAPAAEFVEYIPMHDSFWAEPTNNASDPSDASLPTYLRDNKG
jgi:hypothetical protein